MKDVVQKQLEARVETPFHMRLKRCRFLVKNFTDGNITVRLGDNLRHSTIGPLSYEVVFNNIDNAVSTVPDVTNIVTVIAEASGLVEIASID